MAVLFPTSPSTRVGPYTFYPGRRLGTDRGSAETSLEGASIETSTSPDVDGRLTSLRRCNRMVASCSVVCVYVLIGLAAWWPDLSHISVDIFSQATLGDPQQAVWFFSWEQYAVLHGLNPLFSHALFVPTGLNLGVNAAAPLLGILALPLAPFLGPVTIFNLVVVVAMPLSATSAFFVLRKWKVWLPAAAIGGLIYGFAPNMVGQNLDLHIELTFLPLPPLIAATVVSIFQRSGRPWRLGLQLGTLVAAQYLISPEVTGIVLILGVVSIALVAIRSPSIARQLAIPVAPSVLIGGLVTLVLLAYPLWMLIAGPQHVPDPPHMLNNPYNKNDLLNFVVPGPTQRITLGMRSMGIRVVDRLITGESSYIGGPVLVVVGYLLYRSWRVPRVQLASALLLLSAILTLGPHLVVDGHSTRFPLPFLIIDHIPSLKSLVPPRVAFGVDTCLAALIAFSLDAVHRYKPVVPRQTPKGRLRMAGFHDRALAITVLVVLVVTLLPRWPYPTTPASTLPSQIRRAIPAGDPIAITYPYAAYRHVEPMEWQATDGFAFRLLGGYGYHAWPAGADPGVYIHGWVGNSRPEYPPPMNPAGLQRLLADQEDVPLYGPRPSLNASLVDDTRATLAKYRVKVVIVDRSATGSGPVADLFSMTLGSPTASDGPFVLWDVGSHE
jgi:hypothetical protein